MLNRNRTVHAGPVARPVHGARLGLALGSIALAILSCGPEEAEPLEPPPPVGSVRQAITDTDSDGMDDAWETTHFGNLAQTASGDFDADGMTNLQEYQHGFIPTVDDGFDDADGDRYPNVFEVRNSSDPNSAASTPASTFVVDGTGAGTHTTLSAAINAANVANGPYQIIGVAPGVYKGSSNHDGVTFSTSKPKFLVIGLQGADDTIFDGEAARWGWNVNHTAVIASITFRKSWLAFWVNSSSANVRFVDILARDNAHASYATGVHVNAATKVEIVGSTFLDNTGSTSYAHQVWIGSGAGKLTNTVIYGQTTTGSVLAKSGGATLTTNHCLAKGQTLTGTGNLAGSTDPKLRADARLRWDSPLRAAGGTVTQSRVDIDSEPRPATTPDIGVDQFVDSDADNVADHWELATAGNLTTLTGPTQDADSDGRTNAEEYLALTNPTLADTDGDGLADGAEVTQGTDALNADSDGDGMPDGWEVTYGLNPLLADGFDDLDGDRYPNVFEYARGSAPNSAASIPAPNRVVDASGGGTHTTMLDAVNASNVANGEYQIIGLAPGVYKGVANTSLITIHSGRPKLLVIGLQGAEKTVIDGESAQWGWSVNHTAVISSLTFRRTRLALWVSSSSAQVRFVDLLVRDNADPGYASGVHVNAATKVDIVGSTFIDNTGSTSLAHQIYIGSGAGKITNTVVQGQTTSGFVLAKASGATLATSYSLAKGQTLSGTGNLAGTTDPKLRSDGHLRWDSPLRSAGGSTTQSRVDIDGEARPTSAPDIGVDQFNDTDADNLPDHWEVAKAGNLTTLTSLGQDGDGDGLTNEQEYLALTNPTAADTDGDGLSDGSELNTHGLDPLKADSDGDDMPDGWEVTYGLDPHVKNGYEDADGDRYPNIFEYARGSAPNNASSTPTANFVVDGTGAGTHTNVKAAVDAANVSSGAYQIIGVAPGVYTGTTNLDGVLLSSLKPKFLLIGLQGADKTVFDGEGRRFGWSIYNSAVVSSLTFKKTWLALWVDAASSEVRLMDLLVRDNAYSDYAGGAHVNAASSVQIVGSTFLDNTSLAAAPAEQIYVGSGTATMVNSVVWTKRVSSVGPLLAKAAGATLVTNNSFVKDQTLSGSGNIAGSVDPKLRSDGRLRSDSPLRGAAANITQSRVDLDGELRPPTGADIGVDQFNDADADGLPDGWEIKMFGNTTTVAGSADEDGDGLNNVGEYDWESDRLVADTDGDGVRDGFEVTHGMNPRVRDSEELIVDQNGDGLMDGLGLQLGYGITNTDDDGDSISNQDEVLACTNPLRADTDGDGVDDANDAFPFDPQRSALVSNPADVTAPVITLTAPWYAVEL